MTSEALSSEWVNCGWCESQGEKRLSPCFNCGILFMTASAPDESVGVFVSRIHTAQIRSGLLIHKSLVGHTGLFKRSVNHGWCSWDSEGRKTQGPITPYTLIDPSWCYWSHRSVISWVTILRCESNLCSKLEYRIKHMQISTVSIQRVRENKINPLHCE